MSHETIKILLVEDNEADIMLTQDAFEDAKLRNEMAIARDGYEALGYLNQTGQSADAVLPDVILLDLNLPGPSGKEILAHVRSTPHLKDIPVLVLTSSEDPYEVKQIYDLAANSYVTKPIDLAKFMDALREIEHFWVQMVALPLEPA
jgi:CheY-like chemotaxis protein